MRQSNVMQDSQFSPQNFSSHLRVDKCDSEAPMQPRPSSKDIPDGISSATEVVVLCWTTPGESDRRARKIAKFMGATVQFFTLTPAVLKGEWSASSIVPTCSCLIVEAETLAKIAETMPSRVGELLGVLESAKHVFVYGFRPNKGHDAVLQALSGNALGSTRSLSDADTKLNVAVDEPEWCFQFSGLCVGSADPTKENSFVKGSVGGELAALIRIGDEPFLVRSKNGRSQLFLLAGGELADLDESVTRHCSGLKWFCGLVPLMMFLRGALKEKVWQNDQPRACFIIDDPLLKSRHGFLEYKRLLKSLSRQQFSASIAFIPWNYRRSSREVTELFSSNTESAFLCVHGCDHTGAEFEARDTELLRGKAQLSLDRMRKHQQLSGIPFDEIMVFPQGLFSAEAIPALKAAGYLAAVNTELSPSTMSQSLSIRDLLDVAVTRFADFPLFGRRYPNDLAEFAFDLFVGKPVLAVEHHGYFKGGYDALETFIKRLNALDRRIEWKNLDTICSHACLRKTSANGDVYVRFYTHRFSLKNTSEHEERYVLCRRRVPGDTLPRVNVDGRQWSSEQEGDNLKICLSLRPGQTADIEILSERSPSGGLPWKPTKTHNLSVWLRRVLCEVRDNYVDTSRILSRIISRRRIRPSAYVSSGVGTTGD